MAKSKSESKPAHKPKAESKAEPKVEPKAAAKSGAKAELTSLGRYKINGVLGKGAMGLVYDALDPQLDRRVAIKTIITKNLDEATAKHYAMRFKREVRAVAKVNHGNIVQVYDFGTEGDLNYIVMEYIQGKELKDSFDSQHRFDLETIFRMMAELLEALHFAHQAGVIHRDIKPANVMVDVKGHVKLADFGVARVNDPDAEGEKTRVGAVIGTPSYMSPEQTQGQPIDHRTDLFSAGILFYQLLTGEKPFDGTGWGLAKKIIQDDPVWPSTILEVPPAFDRVVAKALAKEPDQRYQTARKFAEDLKRLAAGKDPEAPAIAAPQAAASAPAAAAAPVSNAGGEADKEFWEGVKDSDDPDDVKLYLEQFPDGTFAEQAKQKIAALGKKR
jgi:serine/threonine-protein kinase